MSTDVSNEQTERVFCTVVAQGEGLGLVIDAHVLIQLFLALM